MEGGLDRRSLWIVLILAYSGVVYTTTDTTGLATLESTSTETPTGTSLGIVRLDGNASSITAEPTPTTETPKATTETPTMTPETSTTITETSTMTPETSTTITETSTTSTEPQSTTITEASTATTEPPSATTESSTTAKASTTTDPSATGTTQSSSETPTSEPTTSNMTTTNQRSTTEAATPPKSNGVAIGLGVFGGILGMCFIIAVGIFLYKSCSYSKGRRYEALDDSGINIQFENPSYGESGVSMSFP